MRLNRVFIKRTQRCKYLDGSWNGVWLGIEAMSRSAKRLHKSPIHHSKVAASKGMAKVQSVDVLQLHFPIVHLVNVPVLWVGRIPLAVHQTSSMKTAQCYLSMALRPSPSQS